MVADMRNPVPQSAAVQTRHSWINFVLFQSVYTLSLVGVINNVAWIGCLGLAAFAIWHARTSKAAKTDFLLVGIAVVVGALLDTLYMRSGLITYNGELLWSGIAPLWILALWANFALTLGGCLSWLRGRLALAAVPGLHWRPALLLRWHPPRHRDSERRSGAPLRRHQHYVGYRSSIATLAVCTTGTASSTARGSPAIIGKLIWPTAT